MKPRTLRNLLFAVTTFQRLRGLMVRGRWPSAWAGIFFPDCRALHTFFTFLRPDVVFLDREMRILKILPSVGPWNVLWGPRGSRHALELPSGTAEARGLKKGGLIRCEKK